MKRLVLLAIALVAMVTTASAQIGGDEVDDQPAPSDPRIAAALDKLGYKYEVTSSGAYKMTFNVDSSRTQIVLINSKTETYGGFEIREIWSPGYKAKGMIPLKVANLLLTSSFEQKLGAWQVLEGEEESLAVFAVKISAGSSPSDIDAFVNLVVQAADGVEKELTGDTDEF